MTKLFYYVGAWILSLNSSDNSIFQSLHTMGPPWHSQFSIIRRLSFSCVLYSFVMKMFFTSILKFHSSQYLWTTFQSNMGNFSTGPPDLGVACIGLVLLTVLSVSLTAITAALVVWNATCVTKCVMFYPATIFVLLSLKLHPVSLLVFCYLVCLLETSCLLLLTPCNVTNIEGW